jgi:hypothetical protein
MLRGKGRPLHCPRCHSHNVGPWGTYHYRPGLKRYRCKACRRTFNDLTQTLLAQSKQALSHWILRIGIPKPLFSPRAAAASPMASARLPRPRAMTPCWAPRRRGCSKPPCSRRSGLKSSRWSLESGLKWMRERGGRQRQPEGVAAAHG